MATSRMPSHEDLLNWVERVAMLLAPDGLPPIAGRILGWLMICDPPEQSAAQIGEAIGASRASLTTNMRVLTTMGFVARRPRPGDRTAYYRIDDDAWQKVVRRQIDTMTSYLELTKDGMELVGPDSARAARVRDAYEVFAWMAKVFADAPPLPPGKRD
jgi:DNA-binding transcriptional regulator GbsR (MarR family)